MKPVVFYIDDEPFNLTVFEAALPEDWDIRTYQSPMEALKELDLYKPWVILSDQRMPGMSGVQFLEYTRKIVPKAIRMVVTGYSDESLIIDTVRKAHIFDYIRKPWDAVDLEARIRRAIEQYASDMSETQMIADLQVKQKTVEAELLKALAQQAEALERSNKELEQFAYIASHDLQEPLRKVASFCTLLQQNYQGQLSEEADRWINYAVDGAKRLQTLVQNLLEYSRLDAQAKPLEMVSSEEIVRVALANLAVVIEEKKVNITAANLGEIYGDSSQLTQVFQNLIGNGIKFHGANQPHVHIAAETLANETVFSIQDNGIGIDPAFKEKIFAIFARLHAKDSYPGSGIGLAVCKRIIERHGGKIWVESVPGQGSLFKFSIPHAPRANQGLEKHELPKAG